MELDPEDYAVLGFQRQHVWMMRWVKFNTLETRRKGRDPVKVRSHNSHAARSMRTRNPLSEAARARKRKADAERMALKRAAARGNVRPMSQTLVEKNGYHLCERCRCQRPITALEKIPNSDAFQCNAKEKADWCDAQTARIVAAPNPK